MLPTNEDVIDFDKNSSWLQIKWVYFQEIELINIKSFLKNSGEIPTSRKVRARYRINGKIYKYEYDVKSIYKKKSNALEIIYEKKPKLPSNWNKSNEWTMIPGRLIIKISKEAPKRVIWMENGNRKYVLKKNYEWVYNIKNG